MIHLEMTRRRSLVGRIVKGMLAALGLTVVVAMTGWIVRAEAPAERGDAEDRRRYTEIILQKSSPLARLHCIGPGALSENTQLRKVELIQGCSGFKVVQIPFDPCPDIMALKGFYIEIQSNSKVLNPAVILILKNRRA